MPASPLFRDPRSALPDRARDLLARLTPEERLALLHQHQPPVDRLGIAAFHTGNEALHGLAWLGAATVFPQPVGMGATWDADLLRRIGDAVSTEVRARHAQDAGVSLNVWAPVVNPLRHPAWGRGEEGYSEEPWLVASLATSYCQGLKGDDARVWKTVPTLKHFLGYGNETDRAATSSNLDPRSLHEYELPCYLGPVRAGAAGAVMPSYNRVNGVPAHIAGDLIARLREAAPGSLAVVSDAGAPSFLVTVQRAFPDHAAGHAAMVRAGVDSFTDHDQDASVTLERLREALGAGLMTWDDVDVAALRLIELRIRTGELDSPELAGADPYRTIGPEAIDLPEHRLLAREAAARCVVLLRNDGLLPLSTPRGGSLPRPPRDAVTRDAVTRETATRGTATEDAATEGDATAGDAGGPGTPARIAVVGPHADQVLTDWYSGTPPYTVTLADAVRERWAEVQVDVVTGADRVALRALDPDVLVSVEADGTVTACATEATFDTWFDVTDWSEGLLTLRSVASGRLLTGADWIVTADADRVGGWVVQESFRRLDVSGAWALQHVGSGRWLRVQRGMGALVADATRPEDATRFAWETLYTGADDVARAANGADAVLVAVGNDPHLLGRETEDRPSLPLPEPMRRLWRAARDTNPASVLVVISSYPYVLDGSYDDARAVVWTCHAGQELGHGLVDVLSGDSEPYGRLAQTWPATSEQAGDLFDYDVRAQGQTYRWLEGEPAFWFGHGLGYANVAYTGFRVSPAQGSPSGAAAGGGPAPEPRAARDGDGPRVEEHTATVTVRNDSDRPAEELVQVYSRGLSGAPVETPRRLLLGHARARLLPGETRGVVVPLHVDRLAVWDETAGRLRVQAGDYTLAAGPSAGTPSLLTSLTVHEEATAPS
ncbi:glycoside hydrolase family 3 protein [Myceligenerans sp. I2]|uniref:Glycoside hydrolase family 3 protein n=1 Tax=Myceligenerans indicum TaxID=2593663 RepID=A0ABS1LI43_9MICO|nr:glycoside hydrolase family 3 protein [Myceligenerans indicum]